MKNDSAKKIGFAALMLVVLAIGALFYFGPKPLDNDARINVFAASSFAWVLNENRELIEEQTGLEVIVVEAASSTLARQITEGAPADVFITADNMWLDYLTEKNVPKDELTEIARNSLGLAFEVMAFARFCPVQFVAQPDAPTLLTACPYTGRIVTGDPAFVPLGKYTAEAMEFYKWDFTLVPALNARAALVLFDESAVMAGIFYKTDILSSEKPMTWYAIPTGAHAPIIYWAVPLKDSNDDATENFINFLKSQAFRTILEDKGFAVN